MADCQSCKGNQGGSWSDVLIRGIQGETLTDAAVLFLAVNCRFSSAHWCFRDRSNVSLSSSSVFWTPWSFNLTLLWIHCQLLALFLICGRICTDRSLSKLLGETTFEFLIYKFESIYTTYLLSSVYGQSMKCPVICKCCCISKITLKAKCWAMIM